MQTTSHLNRLFVLATLVALCVVAAVGTTPARAATSTGMALSAITNPPPKSGDIFSEAVFDSGVAGLCVNWSQVVDAYGGRASGTQLSLTLGYPSTFRETLMQNASTIIRLSGLHVAIWLYRWNGYTWAYAGQTRIRYATAAYPYWSKPVSDGTLNLQPYFSVPDNSGAYTIRVGLVNSAGALVDSAFVRAFGHPSLDSDSAYCVS